VWWSRELEEIFGLPPGTFAGDEAGFFAYLHEDDKAPVERAVQSAIAEKTDYAVEFRFRHASGAWRWMEGRGRALYDAAGMPSMLYGIGIDITERRRADEELRRLNAELSDADRRKDEFIAMLAHELRNPLAPVRFAVEILRLRAPAQPEVQHARETIDRQVTQMAKLLDDLLDVARVSRGKLQMQPVPTSLASVLAMAVETSRPLIISSRHALDLVMPPADLMIVADPARMTQVFANLLNNAARYTPAGGRLALSAAAEGGQVVVRVTDNGVGIPADQLEAIFEPFAQAHGEVRSGGLGLGLALARAIVALHDGTIVGRSDGPGLGCEFVVTLPAANGDEAASGVTPPAARGAARPLEVLVVDDNRDAADSLAALLALDGHRVTAVYDGATGVRRAAASRVDVVLLDIGLPDVPGYDVARQLREAYAGKRLTIVAISGWGQDRDKARAIEAGCDGHLTKPADPDAVRAMLEAIAGSI
jgi:PAS domain S-box-containing protein